MSPSKKIDLERDFSTGVYLSAPPPWHTVYVYIYGKGGRVEPEKRLEGQQFTKLGRKYQHDWQYLQYINSKKHLPQSPFTGKFF